MSHCTLISGPFGEFAQFLLGIIALSSLYYKRHVERPKRPLKIWALDASKQAFAAGFAHIANILIAILVADDVDSADECAFYFVNGMVDTTMGVFWIYWMLHCLVDCSYRYNWTSLQHPGRYGDPPSLHIWWIQFWSWIAIVLITKFTMGFLIFIFKDPLSTITEILFYPLRLYPKGELILVMLVFPAVMNIIQFWLQDNFIKNKPHDQTAETAPLVHHLGK